MFSAKVYRVKIASAGTIVKEERLAINIINRWSLLYGEQKGVVFLPMAMESDSINPDIFIFVADSYVDESLVDSVLAKGVPVIILSSKSHDICNSILGEIKAMDEYRGKIQSRCRWVEFDGTDEFERELIDSILALS